MRDAEKPETLKNDANIRRLYRPVQPTVKQTGCSASYTEISPDQRLHDFIYCYWDLRIAELQDPFTYRVVADGCIDIFFLIDNPSESFVMGFFKQCTEFPIENTLHYVGIRFLPTVFPSLFEIDAKEVSNRFERLELVLAETSKFITDNFSSSDDFPAIKGKLDAYFVSMIERTTLALD
ncbi:MAG: DUF6597 domain-containing transcriptional factor, partial [Bacteroidota bacterium]